MLLVSSVAHADEPTPAGAAARSCVLPGWGQYALGDKKKAWTFAGMAAALVAGTTYAYLDAQDARRDYKRLGVGTPPAVFDEAYQRQRETAVFFQLMAIGTGTFWGYTVVDAATTEKNPELAKALHDVDVSLGRAPACH